MTGAAWASGGDADGDGCKHDRSDCDDKAKLVV